MENSQHCCVLLYTVHCTIGWVDFVAMRKVYYVLIPGNESVLMDFLCNAALLCTYCILYCSAHCTIGWVDFVAMRIPMC